MMIDKIKQLMEMKKQAEQIKRELESISTEINEARGITIAINGAQHFQSIVLEENLLNTGNKQRLENDLLRSVNAAVRKSQQLAAQKMSQMPGLNLPGL